MSDTKTRLTLTRYNVTPSGTVSIDRSKTFTVMLNPAEFTHDYTISYNTRKTLGQVGSDTKFSAVNPDKIRFSILLDGTGAVLATNPGAPPKDVKTQLANLRSIVYDYVGTRHEPSHVRVLWGTLIFFGRLEGMSTQYTLFKPSGDPLRAKVDMRFVGSMSKSEEQLVANKSSPDLTHRILVKDGDTLPLLCDAIYGDASYYPEVARFNGLVNFRDLRPGQQLQFPPLE
ncbi:MAG: peptidoglycan-binding protein [Betaproteobacteria bacterium]|nr:peptidoglycan-binding protein [Betaproteobacteria bacterium]